MDLTKIKITHYRSIQGADGGEVIEFEGLNCLVGKNNAGKTNILSAVKFLLDDEDKDTNEELFWKKETGGEVDVRGFFTITQQDLDRIESDKKRNKIENSLLDENGYDRTLAVCQRATYDEGVNTNRKLLQFLPDDEDYSKETFIETRDKFWDRTDEPEFTKTDYRDAMQEEYPEVDEYVREGKKKNKQEWENGYERYVNERPDELSFSLQPTKFPSGIKQFVYEAFLPQVISIPAVKEVESTTKRGGEFGTVLKQLSDEVQEDLDERLHNELGDYNPADDKRIKRVERQLDTHLDSTFEKQSVSFHFPQLSTEYLFKNADIKVQDNNISDISKENVGEGVKRTLIFSLIRTLADIRDGRVEISDDTDTRNQRPLLFLYEEADLFLHPSLQKTLLRTLEQLSGSNAQVLFSTHSPVLVQHDTLDTINMVQTGTEGETVVTQFHEILRQRAQAEQSRLTDLQSVSSYIFAEQIVLVEGISDRIVLKKLAKVLNDNWDFERSSVPIIDVDGKGDVSRFYRLLNDLGIETYAVFDIDAVSPRGDDRSKDSEIETIIDDESVEEAIEELTDRVWEAFGGVEYDSDELDVGQMPWDDAFERLKDLESRLEDGDVNPDDDSALVEKVLQKCEQSTPPKELWTSEQVADQRHRVINQLLDRNVLLLNGQLEDYYPAEGSNKREAAIRFNPSKDEKTTIKENFCEMADRGTTDIEYFFKQVFEDTEVAK